MTNNYPFEYNDESVKEPKFKGYTTRSQYIKLKDGIKIAADLYLPKELQSNKKVTTVLAQTRYWRAYNLRIPFKWIIKEPRKPKIVKSLTSLGLGIVWVDVRGTGASEGTRPYPFSDIEIQDGREIIDWIISQQWSDGNVVTYGNSYAGVTSELATSLGHPAIKAAVIKHNPWDFYLHAVFPGGCFNEKFITLWSNLGRGLDQTKGKAVLEMKAYNPTFARIALLAIKSVKPVEIHEKMKNLEKIAKIHENNGYPIDYFEKVKSRDDTINELGVTINSISIFSKKDKIEKANVPLYTWGSWQDSTTANSTILRFINFSNPQKAIISDWCHRDKNRANPYFNYKAPADPNQEKQVQDWVKFYKDCVNNEFNSKKVLYYYTMGEEKWKKTNKWPPDNQKMKRWFLNENNELTSFEPQNESGADDYTVNYEITTGKRNRWYTLFSLPIKYPNREIEDKKLLVYNSAPLKDDIEVTGAPIITFLMKSTHEDGMICVHFEFIDEKGKVHWITDGQLRFIHRKISSDTPPYKTIIPYHTYKREDILPLIPDEIAEIKFALYPTSILLKSGSIMRIAISGADKDTFARYPEEGTPTLTIERNKKNSSFIEIPIIHKE